MNESDNNTTVAKRSDNTISKIIFSTLKKISIIGIVYFVGYMQWSVGWFVSPLIYWVIKDHWRETANKKRNIAKLAALSREEDVVLARLDDLPAWVFFPDVERAEWMNRILKQIWPNVNHYVHDLIRDTIQPSLRESLSGFKFERIILGNIPFRIGGVKVYDKNIGRNEIIMDIDVIYAGDCDITFQYKGMKAGIRDFQMNGMLRVVMKPLIRSIPLVGGLQIFFLNNPEIDFDLVGMADFLDLPGLRDMLRKTVTDSVGSMMVLPNKLPIQLSTEIDVMELKAPEPEGVLRVHVVEAKDLEKKDIGMLGKGKSDPYAVITLGAQSFKTKVIDDTVNPKWDYWCEAEIGSSEAQLLTVTVWDRDLPGAQHDDYLGRAVIEVSSIVTKGEDDMWINLEQVKHGMVHLRLVWFGLSKNYSDLKIVLEEAKLLRVSTISTALLTIFIDSAKNLLPMRSESNPDPYAVVRVGNSSQQTNVIMRTIHPVWEEGFTFLVGNPESDTIYLKIVDQKTNLEMGNLVYQINKLSDKTNLEILKEPFPLSKAGQDSKIILSMHLRILLKGKPKQEVEENDPSENLQQNQSQTPTASGNVWKMAGEENVEPSVQNPLRLTEVTTMPSIVHRSIEHACSSGSQDLGRIQLTLRYSIQRQRLIVVVHKIANIPVKDPSNVPDPYVKLYLLPERAKDTKRKTQVIKDNCNPVFDETFEYVLSQGELNSKQLEITVGTQKQLFYSKSNVLGMVVIDFAKLNLNQPYTGWFDLSPESQFDD